MKEIRVYNPGTDDMEPVTQEWCDGMQESSNLLALQRELARKIIGLHIRNDKAKIRAISAAVGEILK